MHLGLIDRPFVPHNLISTQESPVPLLKFQMAPRLKIFITLGSKKEPRYTLLVCQKSRQTNPLQVPQQGPHGEGGPLTGHFTYLSKTSSFGFPSKGALPQGPPNGILRREMPHHYSPPSIIYQSLQYTSPPAYQVPLDWIGAPRRYPYPETFSTYLPGSPVKELPPRPPPQSLVKGRDASSTEPPLPSLKVPGRWALLQFPQTGPLWKEMPISRAFFYISYRVPSKGARPPGSLNRAPTERDPPPLEPLSTTSQRPR